MRVLGMCVLVAMAASPAMAVWVEQFSYPDGPLGGNANPSGGTWEYDSTTGIDVSGQTLKISSGGGTAWNWNTGPNETGSVVTVTADVMAGVAAHEGFYWYLYLGDQTNTYNIGYWYGSSGLVRSRMGGSVKDNTLSGPGTWDHLKAEVDFTTHQTRFYFNGVLNHTITHGGSPTAVGLVEINHYDRPDIVGGSVYFDNIVIPEPASLILLALGGLILRRRRA